MSFPAGSTILTNTWRLLAGLLGLFLSLLSVFVGRFAWQAPGWLQALGRQAQRLLTLAAAHRKQTLALLAGLAVLGGGGWYGWQWYQAQPKPMLFSFSVTEPGRTEIEYEGLPKPLTVEFSGSVAPLAHIGKTVTTGITMEPAIAGAWTWTSGNRLDFQPKTDWPVGSEYRVTFAKVGFFKEGVQFDTHDFKFATAPFKATVASKEFHLDPTDANGKTAEFTIQFSHPVDTTAFEKLVTLRMEGQNEGVLGMGGATTPFTVSYDKLKLNAFIHSAPLPIPQQATYIDLTVAAGMRAATGSPATTAPLTAQVAIPGAFGLALEDVTPTLATNEQQEPERALILNWSAPVNEKEVTPALKAWLLPERHPKQPAKDKEPHYWDSNEVGPEILKLAKPVPLTAVPGEQEYETLHSFRYSAEVGRFLYVTVNKGVKSFHGYQLRDHQTRLFQVEPFPPELKILGEGALLPMSGDKRISVMTRDIKGVRFEIGRLLPQQIQHLVSQSDGSFTQPEFYSRLNEDNITERFEQLVDIPNAQPGKTHFESLDLAKYLDNGGNSRRGIFLLTVTRYERQRQPAAESVPSDADANEAGDEAATDVEADYQPESDYGPLRDRRLILVTDLGIVVKKSVTDTYDVFVQSLHTGAPVGEASIEVIARNGQTIVSQTTDASGRASLPALGDYTREKTPLLFLVRKGGDMSFLPFNRYDRQLDYSRFDIGGILNPRSQEQLSAYLFSERGIYRPGDPFHIGMIVRPADWKKDITGVPLEVEVRDPRGLVIKREKLKLPTSGLAEFNHATTDTAPTGTYTINLSLIRGDQAPLPLGSTTIKVQEFLPDRMKVTAHLSQEVTEGWVKPDDLKARVSVANLFGTAAQDRRVEATLNLTPAFVSFPSHRDYVFHDPQRAKESFSDKLGDGKTNDKGEAEFDLHLERFAAATYRLHLLVRAFEPEGGRSVAAETGVMVSSLPYLVGVKPDGALDYVAQGATRKAHIIAIDPQAKKTAVEKLTLALIERKYVSVLTKQYNGTYKFESRRKETTLSETVTAVPAAGLNYTLPTTAPGTFILSLRNEKGLELNRLEFSVAGQANVSRSLDRNAELQLALNKKDYAPGEEIEISVKAPYTGAGLITIERDKVYAHAWFKAGTTASVQKIRVPKDFEGNGYVNVQFLRDPGSSEIYMSPLSYGVAPFSVNLEARRNPIHIAFPNEVKPGDTLKLKVKADRPAQAVVFAVDEGILQVAGYKNADPLGHFFQKRMLEVKTSQILDLLLPEFQKLMQAAAPGGDGDGALGRHLNPFKRKRDKPAVYWSGVVDIGPNERELSYTVPESFNGSLRVMAVTVNPQTIGVFSGQTISRGDVILLPNVPSMVAPGDEFDLSVGVANNLRGSGQDAPVTVQLKTSPHLDIVGNAKQELKIGELREGTASFRLRALDKLGSASLTLTGTVGGSVGGKSATLTTDTSVRPATPYTVQVAAGNFGGGKFELPIARKLHDEYRQVTASISPLPLTVAPGLVAYLDSFPYSCTEQLTSKGVAALIVGQRPELGRLRVDKDANETQAFAALINNLRSRQNEEGGFGLWEATHETDDFASVYAIHFLMEARDRGQPVPRDMLEAGLRYLQQLAATPPESLYEARVRAHATYLLARNGQVASNYVAGIQQYLERRQAKAWQKDIAAGYLAASYQLMKQDRQANELMSPLETALRADAGNARAPDWYYEDYYDPAVRNAMTLYLLSAHFPNRLKALPPKSLEALVAPVARGNFNTLSSALTLLALDTYVKTVGGDAKVAKMAIQEVLANGSARPVALAPGIVSRGPVTPEADKLRYENSSELPAYYGLIEAGFDRTPPATEIKDGMEVFREYVDATGKPVTSVRLGEEIEVRLKIRSVGRNNVYSVALVDLLPGGFEPVLQAAPAAEEGDSEAPTTPAATRRFGTRGSTWPIENADIREDRIVLYGSATANVQQFVYRMRATNAGTFRIPPAYAESMYERGLRARSLPGQITVQK